MRANFHRKESQEPELNSQAQALGERPANLEFGRRANSQMPEADSQAQALSKQPDNLEFWKWKQTLRRRP